MDEKNENEKDNNLLNKLFFPYIPTDEDEISDKTASIVIGIIVGIVIIGIVVWLFFPK